MPKAARIGDSVATGHGCDATTTIQGNLQGTVRVEGKLLAVRGDILAPHTILSGTVCVPHTAYTSSGSSSVSAHGIAVCRVGDAADAGSITSGASTVNIGG